MILEVRRGIRKAKNIFLGVAVEAGAQVKPFRHPKNRNPLILMGSIFGEKYYLTDSYGECASCLNDRPGRHSETNVCPLSLSVVRACPLPTLSGYGVGGAPPRS